MKYNFGGRASGKTYDCIEQVINSRPNKLLLNTAKTILIVDCVGTKRNLMKQYAIGDKEIYSIQEVLSSKSKGVSFDNYIIDELDHVLWNLLGKPVLAVTDTPEKVTNKTVEDNPGWSTKDIEKFKEMLKYTTTNYVPKWPLDFKIPPFAT